MSAFQQPVSTREEIRSRVEEVLARDEFGQHPSWIAEQWAKLLDTLGEWIGDLFGLADPATRELIVRMLLWLVVAMILAGIVAWIVRWLRDRERDPEARELRPREDIRAASVAALRREAKAASDRGEPIIALRLLFRALVLGLSEQGVLEYRDAWTNRELFERGAPRRDVAPILSGLVPRLDAQSFGREPAGPEDVERLSSLCDRLLGSVHA